MPIWAYDEAMARAATTSDVFNAIAEPRRREILVLLRAGERPVTELARELGMDQPRASKRPYGLS
jgi:DNA-binding transcriptional ArsR family regulator